MGSSRAIGKIIYSKGNPIFDLFSETFLWPLRVSKVVTIAIEWVSRKWTSYNRIYFGANQHTKTTKVRTLRTVRWFADCLTHRKSNCALTYQKWRVVSNVWKWVAWYTGCRIVRLTYRKLRGVNNLSKWVAWKEKMTTWTFHVLKASNGRISIVKISLIFNLTFFLPKALNRGIKRVSL